MTKAFEEKHSNNKNRIRIGKEVPPDDINLAYVHSEDANPEENINLIKRTSGISDNIIPSDQQEAIVTADEEGKIQYADITEDNFVEPRPPYEVIPNKDVFLTKEFIRNEHVVSEALYYKVDILYHYDSDYEVPEANGEHYVHLYKGTQIALLNENKEIITDEVKHLIYVWAMKENPHIFRVRVYMQERTTENETFYIQYNHISEVRQDDRITHVNMNHRIQLYVDSNNRLQATNDSMLKSGQVRIANGESAFERKGKEEILEAQESFPLREIYALEENEKGSGYDVYVPQRTEIDPRDSEIFHYRAIATYRDQRGREVKITGGWVSDEVKHPDVLLDRERYQYTSEGWKVIGTPYPTEEAPYRMMIRSSLPQGTANFPDNATFTIEDTRGNLLYQSNATGNNTRVETSLQEAGELAAARGINLSDRKWEQADEKNVRLSENSIPHQCTIIPERQQMFFPFKWETYGLGKYNVSKGFDIDVLLRVRGSGTTGETKEMSENWRVSADVTYEEQTDANDLDITDNTKWEYIGGSAIKKSDWKAEPESLYHGGRTVLECSANVVDLGGYYQVSETIDGQNVNMLNESNYEFSTHVRIVDTSDDDWVGLLFRTKNDKEYYAFMWEKHDLLRPEDDRRVLDRDMETELLRNGSKYHNGVGRIMVDFRGIGSAHLGTDTENDDDNFIGHSAYGDEELYFNTPGVNPRGIFLSHLGRDRMRMVRAQDPINFPVPFKNDATGRDYRDIGVKIHNRIGWEVNVEYRLTVVCHNNNFKVYMQDDLEKSSRGKLLMEGEDDQYTEGAPGVFVVSQRYAMFSNLRYKRLAVQTVSSEWENVTLDTNSEKRVGSGTAESVLQPVINNFVLSNNTSSNYSVDNYRMELQNPHPQSVTRIQGSAGNMYVQNTSDDAGGLSESGWSTDALNQNDLSFSGKIIVEDDGDVKIEGFPAQLPNHLIPDDVYGFSWQEPEIIEGFGYTPRIDNQQTLVIEDNNLKPDVTTEVYDTREKGPVVESSGHIHFHTDGHVTIEDQISKLPTDSIPDKVFDFSWEPLNLTSGENINVFLKSDNETVDYSWNLPPIQNIGRTVIINADEIKKSDGIVNIGNVFGQGGLYNMLNIPSNVPHDEIMLRIERGRMTSHTSTPQSPEFRVNYRFEHNTGGFLRYPLDQHPEYMGANRIRFSSFVNRGENMSQNENLSVVAWTHIQELKAVPVFGMKIERSEKIEFDKPPENKRSEDAWFMRVKSGLFHRRIELPYYEPESNKIKPMIYRRYPSLENLRRTRGAFEKVEVDLQYRIPEYHKEHMIEEETEYVQDEKPFIRSSQEIEVVHKPIRLSSDRMIHYLRVERIRNHNGKVLEIKDVDQEKGIIYLHDQIEPDDDIKVSYAYYKKEVSYQGYYDVQNREVFMNMNPTKGHTHTVGDDGFFKEAKPPHKISSFILRDEENETLLTKNMYFYLIPEKIRHASGNQEGQVISGTTRSEVIYHTESSAMFQQKHADYDESLFLLGIAAAAENNQADQDLTILDTRTRGGGIDELISKEEIKHKSELSLWDLSGFDGSAFQENGVIVVKVPQRIMRSEKNPEGYTEEEVQRAVDKHKAMGIHAIVEYETDQLEDEERNILFNSEFYGYQHIGFYNQARSKGDYRLVHTELGAGSNYMLEMNGDAEYAIRIPSYILEANVYDIEIKSILMQGASERRVATVNVYYQDGSNEITLMPFVRQTYWTIQRLKLIFEKEVSFVEVILNQGSSEREGQMNIDYVMIFPATDFKEESTEIKKL